MDKCELFNTKYRVLIVELDRDPEVDSLIKELNDGVSEVIEVETVNRAISTMGVSDIDYVVVTACNVNKLFIDFCEKQHIPCAVYKCEKDHKKNNTTRKIYKDVPSLLHHVKRNIIKKGADNQKQSIIDRLGWSQGQDLMSKSSSLKEEPILIKLPGDKTHNEPV